MKEKYEYNLNPEQFEILSYLECDYGQSAMRRKKVSYQSPEDDEEDSYNMQTLYDKAKTTIEVLVANMVRPDICNHILFNHYQNVTPTNVIKLLMRVKRLYDARNESVNILKNVMEVEAVIKPKSEIWRIIQDNDNSRLSDNHYKVITRTLSILSKSLSKITIFQQEHRLFRNEF